MFFWRPKTDVVLWSQLRFHFASSKMNDDVNDEESKRRDVERKSRRCERRNVFYFHFSHVSAMPPCHARSQL